MPEIHAMFEMQMNCEIKPRHNNVFCFVLCIVPLKSQFLILVLPDIKMSPASAEVDGECSDLISISQVEPLAQSSPSSPALISWVIRPPIRTLLFSLLFIWGVGLHGFYDGSMSLGFSWEKGNNLSLLMVCFLYWSSYLLLTCSSAYEEVLSEISPIKNHFISRQNSVCWM